MSIVYRTTGAWGVGKGSNLVPAEVDQNFYDLLARIVAIEEDASTVATIDHFVIDEDKLYVHMDDYRVLGPYTLPTAQWTWRGLWQPTTVYSKFDVIYYGSTVYIVDYPHTSALTFDAGANTAGNDHYAKVLEAIVPGQWRGEWDPDETYRVNDFIKVSNTPDYNGFYLVKVAHDAAITFDPARQISSVDVYELLFPLDFGYDIAIFAAAPFASEERIFKFNVTRGFSIPIDFQGSVATLAEYPTGSGVFSVYKNGASIGTITFTDDPDGVFSLASTTTFEAGDVLEIYAPVTPNDTLMDFAATIVAYRE